MIAPSTTAPPAAAPIMIGSLELLEGAAGELDGESVLGSGAFVSPGWVGDLVPAFSGLWVGLGVGESVWYPGL